MATISKKRHFLLKKSTIFSDRSVKEKRAYLQAHTSNNIKGAIMFRLWAKILGEVMVELRFG